jgi:hypothetical protein
MTTFAKLTNDGFTLLKLIYSTVRQDNLLVITDNSQKQACGVVAVYHLCSALIIKSRGTISNNLTEPCPKINHQL